jgi:hypothetical protein
MSKEQCGAADFDGKTLPRRRGPSKDYEEKMRCVIGAREAGGAIYKFNVING